MTLAFEIPVGLVVFLSTKLHRDIYTRASVCVCVCVRVYINVCVRVLQFVLVKKIRTRILPTLHLYSKIFSH